MPQNNGYPLILMLLAVFISGCASVTGSNSQSITVAAICGSSKIVKGAMCTLVNDKGQWFIESPSTALIQKSFNELTVSCKHRDAYGILVIKSSSNANIWGNVVAGGFIGAAVDSSTGAGFNYQPMITISMNGDCN